MKDLKIEAGKFYRTREGHKARIYAADGSGEFPVHGAIYYDDGGCRAVTWTSDGSYMRGDESGIDIISEWKQTIDDIGFDKSCLPKWAKFIHTNKRGMWFWLDAKPRCAIDDSVGYWNLCGQYFGMIPAEYAPKNYKGDWKDSLFEVE